MNLSNFRLSHPVETYLSTLIIFHKVEEVKLKSDLKPPRLIHYQEKQRQVAFFRLGYLFLEKAHSQSLTWNLKIMGFQKEYPLPAGHFQVLC